METYKNSIAGLPIGILVALLVTAVLFMGLPLLTKLDQGRRERKTVQSVLISSRRPPPPTPEVEEEKKVEEKRLEKKQNKVRQIQRQRARIDFPRASLGADLGGSISIGGFSTDDFNLSDSLFMTAFNLNEVDQAPRAFRTYPPRYPFAARQKGIEGRITLRFVVDSNGIPQEPNVVKTEPESVKGVFDKAAIETIRRFKFKPAIKDGKAVDCIVYQPLTFTLN